MILKPDGFKRNLLGSILEELASHYLAPRVNKIETRCLTTQDVNFLYGRYKDKSFYVPLRNFMMSAPSIVMELAGNHAVSRVRKIVGDGGYPYPEDTIRGLYATSTRHNVVHCSDCTKAAADELWYFFGSD